MLLQGAEEAKDCYRHAEGSTWLLLCLEACGASSVGAFTGGSADPDAARVPSDHQAWVLGSQKVLMKIINNKNRKRVLFESN